jgi:hypothetical protein
MKTRKIEPMEATTKAPRHQEIVEMKTRKIEPMEATTKTPRRQEE